MIGTSDRKQSTMWWKLMSAVLCCCLATTKGDIRCYCNLPLCVVTGYMCKSALNMCYTEYFSYYSSEISRSRHGCLELLHHEKRNECNKSRTPVTNTIPSVLCCTTDMCNYVNNVDINIQVRARSNSSRLAGIYGYSDNSARDAALQQDVWFRAAVIAVPIAGTFILILLVLLAMRMLRQDSKRHRQFLEMRRQRKMLLLGDQRREKTVQLYLPAPGWNKDYVYEKPINPSFLLWTKWTPEKQPEFL